MNRIFSGTFALSTAVAALAGVLVAPLVGINAEMGAVVLKGFVAAILGGFSSLLGCVVGGIILGVLEVFGGAYIGGTFKDTAAFILLMVILLIRPHGLFGRQEARHFNRVHHLGLAALAILLLVAPPFLEFVSAFRVRPRPHQRDRGPGVEPTHWERRPNLPLPFLIHGNMALLLYDISLDQAGIPFWLALPFGGVITALFGFMLGFPALRLRGFYLAVVTLGFLEVIQIAIEQLSWITGGVRGMAASRPMFFGQKLSSDLAMYYLILAVAVAGIWCTRSILASPTGRAFNAIRNSEAAAQTLAIPLARTKIAAFVISAFYAGIGGGLFASLVGFIDPLEFGISTSIRQVVFIVVGGLGSVAGSVVGAVILTLLPELLRGFKEYNEFIYGGLLLLALIFFPKGLVGLWPKTGLLLPFDLRRRRGTT